MTTFNPTIAPTYSSGKSKEFKILTANFGDGYDQRLPDGINASRESWNLSWPILTLAQADNITDFFDARGGYDSFTWVTPDGDTKKFTVAKYNRTTVANNIFSVSATLEQDLNN